MAIYSDDKNLRTFNKEQITIFTWSLSHVEEDYVKNQMKFWIQLENSIC